jgi:ketosteroid isomerase-like protein
MRKVIRSAFGVTTLALSVLGAQSTPQAAMNELLAADRAFAKQAASADLVTGLSAMFADGVVMPAPPERFVRGKADAVAALRNNAANLSSKASWAPLGGGVSGDGLHGFTFGTLTVTRADGGKAPQKYLAYWEKGAAGWRVVAYKRVPGAQGAATAAAIEPLLPERVVPPVTDRKVLDANVATLTRAEQQFSDLAQKVGLGPAFRETGRVESINLGGASSAGVVVGAAAIAKLVQGDAPEKDGRVHWNASEGAIVASSGDLGVTFGFIVPNSVPDGKPATKSPFFTIWLRPGGAGAWKYIAE